MVPGAAGAGLAGYAYAEEHALGALKSVGVACGHGDSIPSLSMSSVAAMHRYRALLALPGARAPVLLSAAGSMPIGMFGLGILLLARDATGSFAEAGRVVGAFSVANALGAVAQGRLMDRLGPDARCCARRPPGTCPR